MAQKPKVIGVVAGSFDPITIGHAHLISEAALLADELHIVVGVNPSKKYLFNGDERLALVQEVVASLGIRGTPVHYHYLKDRLLIQLAAELNVTHLIRGIRSTEDFTYETQMALVNRKVNREIGTLYIVPPPELSEVSSSTVKGLVGYQDWESIVSQYVHSSVLAALAKKQLEQGSNG